MKCPFCKGKMKIVKDVIKQDAVHFETFRCLNCGEELMDSKQLKRLAMTYRKLRTAKDITFSQWGNSIAVRIPKDIVDEFNITSGKHGLLTKDKDGIKIIPA